MIDRWFRKMMGIYRPMVLISLCILLSHSSFAFTKDYGLALSKEDHKVFLKAMELMEKKDFKNAEASLTILADKAKANGYISNELILKNLLAKSIMHQWRTEEALELYQNIHLEAKEAKLDSLQADAITALVVIYRFQDKSALALPLIKEGLALKNIGYKEKSDLYSSYAENFKTEGKYDSALYYTNLALNVDIQHADSSSLANNYNLLGNIYLDVENKEDLALKNYFLSIDHLSKDKEYHKIVIYSNIGKTMLRMRNIPKALHYCNLALEIAEKTKLTSNLATIHSMLASIDEINEDYNSALEHIMLSTEANKKPNKISTKINNAVNKISCQLKLELEIDTSQLNELVEYAKGPVGKMTKGRIGYIKLFNETRNGISKNAFYKSFNELKKIAEEQEYLYSLKDLFQLEYKFLIEHDDYKNANQAILNYHSYVNDLFKERQEFVTLDLEAKYSKEKQDKQIAFLAKDNLIQEVKLKQQRIYLIGGAIGLIIISILSFFIYNLYIKLASQNSKISKALKEKDFLLREIHHRVKNNLQVISSLLSLQSRQIKDEEIKKAINEGRSRVRSMALIHQNLYQNENLTGVSVSHYMTKLVNELFDTYKIDQDKITLNLDIQEMELDVDTMVPLGLILNELVSNCLKHAFPENRNGAIFVSLTHESDSLFLKVKDNGIGTTLENIQKTGSFGNRLIKAFSQKLNAKMEIVKSNGTEVVMQIRKFKKVA